MRLNDNFQEILKKVVVGNDATEVMSFNNIVGQIERPKVKTWAYNLFDSGNYDYGKLIFSKDLIDDKELILSFSNLGAIDNCIESLRKASKDFISAWYKTQNLSIDISVDVEE